MHPPPSCKQNALEAVKLVPHLVWAALGPELIHALLKRLRLPAITESRASKEQAGILGITGKDQAIAAKHRNSDGQLALLRASVGTKTPVLGSRFGVSSMELPKKRQSSSPLIVARAWFETIQ